VCNILRRALIATFTDMLILLSPAKTIDLYAKHPEDPASLPFFIQESTTLMSSLQSLSDDDLGQTMKLSNKLKTTVSEWHSKWKSYTDTRSATKSGAIPCAFAMKGEAFKSLNIQDFDSNELKYAQEHLIILSGLYGILRPCDLIMPYRLEMGQTFRVDKDYTSLNAYWSARFQEPVLKKLKALDTRIILNLASDEYSKVIVRSGVKAEMVTCSFKEVSSKGIKSISTFAKQARGAMARFVIQNKITEIEKLKNFNKLGYSFNPDLSEPDHIIFTRLTKQ